MEGTTMSLRVRLAILIGLAVLGGCRAPAPLSEWSPPPPPRPDTGPSFGPDGGLFPGELDSGLAMRTSSEFFDPRINAAGPATSAASAPPAITGGTLFVTSTGHTAIVSDADRDRIVVVDLAAGSVTGEASLAHGALPFRAAEDAHGRVHVVLRGSGDVFSFDPAMPSLGQTHHVCAMPRGLAYDATNDELRVACRSGELVTMGTDGTIRATVSLEPDLRDVILSNGHLFVSTFRTAHLIEIDPSTGSVVRTNAPDPSQEAVMTPTGPATFSPSVAWRTLEAPGMLTGPSGIPTAHPIAAVHQRASDAPIMTMAGGYAGGMCRGTSIVESVVTFYFSDGTHSSGATISGATLPVDLAFSPDGSQATIVGAANESGQMAVQTFPTSTLVTGAAAGPCGVPPMLSPLSVTNPIAVAYDAAGELFVQQRDPSALVSADRTIALGGATVFDTGHAVFHANSGSFIACASCHPEGGDDGRTWNFDGIGPRRTPSLHGQLTPTAPFHWDGDMGDLSTLVERVFTGRMSGPSLGPDQIGALSHWLDAIPAPVNEPAPDVAAVARGQALFQGTAGCASCHSGAQLTNNLTLDVGTGGAFQVPSLIGVSDRLPLMHDGCAPTIRARLTDASCGGGASHGNTTALASGDIDDLIAYLNTL
jgi:mono/diheme cytochrome c family protein